MKKRRILAGLIAIMIMVPVRLGLPLASGDTPIPPQGYRCSSPNNPAERCEVPVKWYDCAECCDGGAECCVCCDAFPSGSRKRRLCEARCEDVHDRVCTQ